MTGSRSELLSISEYSFLVFSLIQTSPSCPTYIIFSCFSVQNPVNNHGCHIDVLPPLSSLMDDHVSAPCPHSLFFSSMSWCEESRPGVLHHGAQFGFIGCISSWPHAGWEFGTGALHRSCLLPLIKSGDRRCHVISLLMVTN